MDIRRLVLRLSLGALGVTALSALTLLVLPWGGAAGRFTISALAATIAAAISLPFAAWASREETRWGGLAGILFVVGELLLLMLALWGSSLAPTWSGYEAASAMLYLLMCAPLGIVGAREFGRRRIVALIAVSATVLALFLLFVQAFAYRGLDGFDDASKPWGPFGVLVLLVGGGAALGFVPARVPTDGPVWRRRWPLIGATLALIGGGCAATGLLLTAIESPGGPKAFRLITTAVLLGGYAYAIGLANLLFLPLLKGIGALVPKATAVAALGAATILALWIESQNDTWSVPFIASIILLITGSLSVLILQRFASEVTLVTQLALADGIDLTCPRCRRRQHLAVGRSACRDCGLRYSIEIEEPRCRQCEHLLVGTTSDRCPECGTAIVAEAIT
jgi:uncharacterized membrane-anchored protein YitT (DUF2179 family)